MESLLIWISTLAILAAILIPYFIKFRRKQREFLARKKEVDDLGGARPRSQFPMVDNAACIGCGSCVDACPEGDVLGVIFGKASVIHGDRCVGHGYCELVCPVGALKVGMGDIKSRDDIPIMNEYNETSVPGLYIAGELGGISLIRNAVNQGKMVVNRISETFDSNKNADFDLAIIGCGPAGLTAAVTALDNNLSYIAFDQQDPGGTILQYPRRKLVMTQPVEIPSYGKLENPEYSKEELLAIWLEIIASRKLNIISQQKIEHVGRDNGLFTISNGDRTITAGRVILAMGRRGTPRKLGVSGEDMAKVMYQLVDAQSYSNANILVVGGGDSAVEAAIGLARQPGNKVTLSYRKAMLFRIKKKNEERINELINKGDIKTLFSTQVKEIGEKSVKIESESGILDIPNDFIFVFAGGIPPFDMLKKIGVTFGGDMKSLAG